MGCGTSRDEPGLKPGKPSADPFDLTQHDDKRILASKYEVIIDKPSKPAGDEFDLTQHDTSSTVTKNEPETQKPVGDDDLMRCADIIEDKETEVTLVSPEDFTVIMGGKSLKGFAPSNPNKCNQDSFLMRKHTASLTTIVACMDGHGQFGHDVSQYAKGFINNFLPLNRLYPSDVGGAIVETVAKLELAMLRSNRVDTIFSGSTLSVVVLKGSRLTIANLGDSRAVLGYRRARTTKKPDENGKMVSSTIVGPIFTSQLSTDHKPDLPAERSRITAMGGRVIVLNDVGRVYLAKDDIPGLAMSRSLGDYVAHTAGVSSDPEITEYDLSSLYLKPKTPPKTQSNGNPGESTTTNGTGTTDDDGDDGSSVETIQCVLIVASDGLFDTTKNEEATHVSFRHWQEPTAAAASLVETAASRWAKTYGLADDTTVCVLNLEHVTCSAPTETETAATTATIASAAAPAPAPAPAASC